MATHSSTLAWKIPWTEEPGRLQSMGSRRVGHDWVTSLSLFTFMHGEGNGNPLQCSCLENPRDEGAWWAAVYGVAQSWTRLKRLSSSSSIVGEGNGNPLFLPGKSHGQRSLVGYSPWGRKESGMTERLNSNNTMLSYNVVQWNESAICTHISPSSWPSLPPHPPSQPSQSSQCTELSSVCLTTASH